MNGQYCCYDIFAFYIEDKIVTTEIKYWIQLANWTL